MKNKFSFLHFSPPFIKGKYTNNSWNKWILFLILLLGFFLRLIGLNWDQGQHLHPDERFMTMVSSSISLPQNIADYFTTATSKFNPNNNGFEFYVYGTFPLLITKTIASIFKLTSYDQIFLVGRFLSAIFDTLTIFLVFLISRQIFKNIKLSLISAFTYCLCIFPIQQSHFFTVEAITVLLFTLSIFLLISRKTLLAGFVFGIALASKTSIGIVLPFFLLFIFFQNKNFTKNLFHCFLFALFMCFAFRIFQPYAFDGLFHPSLKFITSISQAHQMITGEINYPPNIQWQHTLPFIHTLGNLFFVGLGPITFFFSFFGMFKFFSLKNNLRDHTLLLFLSIIVTIFTYHSVLLAKYMRYFYPIYPVLIIFTGYGLSQTNQTKAKIFLLINCFLTLFFINIYLLPHSRYLSSEWICQNIPSNSILSSELWDDSLPLNTPSCLNYYSHQELSISDTESDEKWQKINQQLDQTDYLILSSNRFWRSIPQDSQKYPTTTSFYQNLFDGKTNFKLIKTFYSYPGIHLPFLKKCFLIGFSDYPYQNNSNIFFNTDDTCSYPGIYIRDDRTEESFTVYDHPQVLIFQKTTK